MLMRITIIILITIFTSYPQLPLPQGTSALFSGSGNCQNCHITNNSSVLFYSGEDLTPSTHWRSSMMANSSKDPLWRAVLTEEITRFPFIANEIQTTCTRCHAPMGYTQAIQNGSQFYTLAQVKADPLANDGVSCTLCHQIQPANMGADSSYSGHYMITAVRQIFGPYQTPLTMPMQNAVNYTPSYSGHIDQSAFCGTCHTLFTPYLDDQNNIAGTFPEQTPYIEWKNSSYSSNNINCQKCHMPPIDSPIDISTTPNWHNVGRSPFWRHTFVGGNVFMGKLLRNNLSALQLTATAQQFDSTISKSLLNLSSKTVQLDIDVSSSSDTIISRVKIKNLTGHKLPTGIPYRRLWIHYIVKDENGNVVFESGGYNDDGTIIEDTNGFQPHYTQISAPGQTQIYESVLKDINDSVTYTLLRAAAYKKDNRLPPAGFSSAHLSYDTVKIVGDAVNDPDFNYENLNEGSGADYIIYKNTVSQTGQYTVSAEAIYQSVPPALAEHLSHYSVPDIQSFIASYNSSDRMPVKLGTVSQLINVTTLDAGESISELKLSTFAYPNPAKDKVVFSFNLPSPGIVTLTVYNSLGEKVAEVLNDFLSEGKKDIEVNFHHRNSKFNSGVYFYKLTAGQYVTTNKFVIAR